MLRCSAQLLKNGKGLKYFSTHSVKQNKAASHPQSADVVIIGGGSAGCHTLYQLAKRGVNAVLLERSQLTAGTTWHTSGLVWRLRPNDVDVQLLNRTRDTLKHINETTEYSPWIENGGIFIARSKTRLDEYKRLATLGRSFGIDSAILTPKETQSVFPLMDPNSFYGALHSPGDGVIDPSMLCTALTRLANATNNAIFYEHCPVEKILTERNANGTQSVTGVQTKEGIIHTKCVVNASGVWTESLLEPLGISLPLIPMKHSYVVSDPIENVFGKPNVRDHDASIYFRIQGSSIMMGGYEDNPIILDEPVSNDFAFGLYDLDFSVFESHVKGATELCPAFGEAGIKSTVCGPESFTPDHKPLMGPDPRCYGLFHNCGFNSAGMMLGGGCGEQIAEWIVHGQPEFDMTNYDIRRFRFDQMANRKWATERSHEAYAKNYSMVFKNDQPLGGRNFVVDPLFDDMVKHGAVMTESHGYEIPGFFDKLKAPINVAPYDWYGAYGNPKNANSTHIDFLNGESTYDFPGHLGLISAEASMCRKKAAVFNLSYFGKFYLTGNDAQKAVEWICTAETDKPLNETVHTCALNSRGGVESDFMITNIESGSGAITNPKFDNKGYYVVVNGASTTRTLSHIQSVIAEQKLDVNIQDVTDKIGIISIQGPLSRNIVQKLICFELNDEKVPVNGSITLNLGKSTIRIHRISYVGELGYELHIANEDCSQIYNKLMAIGSNYGVDNAGYRAFYSLGLEKGIHQWGSDLRTDDTPIEANLGSLCRPDGEYKGHQIVAKQRAEGAKKRLAYFTIDEKVPLWCLEGVYRNGEAVGVLRRADFGHSINKSIGSAFVKRSDGQIVTDNYLVQGKYEIDVMGQLYEAKLHLEGFLTHNK